MRTASTSSAGTPSIPWLVQVPGDPILARGLPDSRLAPPIPKCGNVYQKNHPITLGGACSKRTLIAAASRQYQRVGSSFSAKCEVSEVKLVNLRKWSSESGEMLQRSWLDLTGGETPN
ncbi:hypothetical protein LA080_007323 [Diaporthe eres]|nr:hypothetical protein LA080_007323 [Diaporthe eres]